MPEVYSRSSDALLRRLLSRKGFTAEDRRSLLRQVRERGSVYLAPINTMYVRQFHMTSSAEDATRFLHQACRGLPNRCHSKSLVPSNASSVSVCQDLSRVDAFYIAIIEHACAFFGSRILYPARPALRDSDLAGLLDLTREDLENEAGLPFADAVDVLQFVTQHREEFLCKDPGSRNARRCVRRSQASELNCQPPEFTGRKYEYLIDRLGSLAGTDLYDSYLEGGLTTTGLRRLFLTHIERPGVARETYLQLLYRLRSNK
jgi:hypothetical protein